MWGLPVKFLVPSVTVYLRQCALCLCQASLLELSQLALDISGSGSIIEELWPSEYSTIRTGDNGTNREPAAKELHWRPLTIFRDGIDKTVEFYRYLRINVTHAK